MEDVDTIDALPLGDAPTVDGVPQAGGTRPVAAISLPAFGPGAEALRRPDESLAALYEKTGRPAKAEAWRKALAKDGETP